MKYFLLMFSLGDLVHNFMKKPLLAILLTTTFLLEGQVQAQNSFDSFKYDSLSARKKRFSFAHMYFGLEGFTTQNGSSPIIGANNQVANIPFAGYTIPRLMWGGTHFWGHADIYLSFPIGGYKKTVATEFSKMSYDSGVETGIKYYPWTVLKSHSLRPYVGIAWNISTYSHQQKNKDPSITQFKNTTPLLFGVGFKHKKLLFEGGLQYFYNNKTEYPVSPTVNGNVAFPKLAFQLSGKYLLETTYQGGDAIKKRMKNLVEHKKFNTFYVGIGPSGTTSVQSKSSYDVEKYPFFANQKRYFGIIPDMAAGYFFSKVEMNLGFSYRKMNNSFTGFNVLHVTKRQSLMLEAYKFLFDYHGFLPFVGLTASRENLYFGNRDNNKVQEYNQTKNALGVIFGWDIRPTRAESWLLRTNLRYAPIKMDVEGKKIAFDYIEFNFIQLVLFPERMIIQAKNKK